MSDAQYVLVTGGAGYIGSHALIELVEGGYSPIVFDNFSNASMESVIRVEQIIGTAIPVVQGDIRNRLDLAKVFEDYDIYGVIHFAGLKAVGESVEKPLKYYDNNIKGTLTLLEVMKEFDCKRIVFSSSATVYGDPHTVPIREDFPLSATNPYGRSKLMIEEILLDLKKSDESWQIVILRYFNPIGAHESGLIGEDPNGKPNNLMPYITQTAIGKLSCLAIFGDDYDTHDGTGVRDYIHVMDLASAHVKAVDFFDIKSNTSPLIVNLGTGRGYSVKELVGAFENASGKKVKFCIAPRRAGDIAKCYADSNYVKEALGWEASRGIEQMCIDGWRWQESNPDGYPKL